MLNGDLGWSSVFASVKTHYFVGVDDAAVYAVAACGYMPPLKDVVGGELVDGPGEPTGEDRCKRCLRLAPADAPAPEGRS
jgi:hypothetical protein